MPLRVGVMVESMVVPEWVAWTVARIAAAEQFALAAVVSASPDDGAGGARPPRPPLASLLYERLDARVFGAAAALRRTRLEALPIPMGQWFGGRRVAT